jgi:hypothetical protein
MDHREALSADAGFAAPRRRDIICGFSKALTEFKKWRS